MRATALCDAEWISGVCRRQGLLTKVIENDLMPDGSLEALRLFESSDVAIYPAPPIIIPIQIYLGISNVNIYFSVPTSCLLPVSQV